MKVAVTYDNGQVFQHFGQTKQFKVYEVEDGQVRAAAVIDAGENGHGALAGFLRDNGVDTLICGGIGEGAKRALTKAEILLYGGVGGSADAAVNDLLAQKLVFNPDIECNHHGDHHHDHADGHQCGGECHS